MRTTIDIPKDLIDEVMRFTRVKTKTSAIILGLKELLRKRKIENIRSLLGKVDLDVDLKVSRAR
ncbi:MAG: type II toxin-antitoxin system VapB family antitoxin [Candidatus Omnitrophota bacterium]